MRVEDDGITATGAAGDTRGDGRWLTHVRRRPARGARVHRARRHHRPRTGASATGEAFGHVRIVEPGAANLVTGGHAVFDRGANAAVVDRGPELTNRDSRGGVLVAESRVMHLYRAEDRVVMVDSVRIRQAMGIATADTAVAYGRERLVLTGSPQVKLNRGSVLSGERIEFEYVGNQLRRVLLLGDARTADDAPDSLALLYPGLPREDILEGGIIVIDFEDDEIRRTMVTGSARSVYTPLDVKDEVATNDVKGDTIIVHFRDRQVRRVRVLGNVRRHLPLCAGLGLGCARGFRRDRSGRFDRGRGFGRRCRRCRQRRRSATTVAAAAAADSAAAAALPRATAPPRRPRAARPRAPHIRRGRAGRRLLRRPGHVRAGRAQDGHRRARQAGLRLDEAGGAAGAPGHDDARTLCGRRSGGPGRRHDHRRAHGLQLRVTGRLSSTPGSPRSTTTTTSAATCAGSATRR